MNPWEAVTAALGDVAARALRAGPEPDAAAARLADLLATVPELAGRDDLAEPLAALCGASRALPALAAALGPAALPVLERGTVGPPRLVPTDDVTVLRRGVAEHMLRIAMLDLTGRLDMPAVGRALSDLADAATETALQAVVGSGTRVSVIGLGKWGGRELNYASDIDLLFVHEGDETEAMKVATTLVDRLSRREGGGVAFRVDADLRPEGRSGPMSRSLDSFKAYWERWAETWELQAMLKARPVAGDEALGAAFLEAVSPFVFPETLGADAVRDIRAMKLRTEAATGHTDEVKRGVGGIRDVEFAVQLLQLVHGRADAALRSANTLDALARLGEGGYVRDEDADALGDAHRWLRNVEHRLQLYDLRQTHTLPDDATGRERIAKALGLRDDADGTALERFERMLVERRSLVRTIHERLFYRPLLEAFAAAPGANDRADRQAAALGFTDSAATRTALVDLTAGLSRRSRLMQQLLPLMMGWLSESPDPDLGLSQLRLLVTTAAGHDEVIPVLRDNPATAERLCRLLGTSRLAGRLIDRLPATLSRLGDDNALRSPADAASLVAEARQRLAVRGDEASRAEALHRFEAEHLLEISAADVAGFADDRTVGHRLADTADAVVAAALAQAIEVTEDVPPMAVIAMGKWGGRELNYASDLDALIVYRSDGDGAEDRAARCAEALVATMQRSSLDLPSYEIDLDLRPEGRKGIIARSLDSYEAYWERWGEPWEHQALLRARFASGDEDLGARFVARAHAYAHPRRLDDDQRRHIRTIKARVEQERIPLGEDPDFHMKLGRGGMSDVEWTVQLLQMEHGARHEPVRTPSTAEALVALEATGILSGQDAAALTEAYRFCATVRNRLFLRSGRTRDSLPTDPDEAARLARSLGYEIDPRTALREEYRRVTRRARRVMERVFYGR